LCTEVERVRGLGCTRYAWETYLVHGGNEKVGAGGLEPPTSRSQTARSNRPELRPGVSKYSLFGSKRQTRRVLVITHM
jgi:hypothetical protein